MERQDSVVSAVPEPETTTVVIRELFDIRVRRSLNERTALVRPKQWSCTLATCIVCERIERPRKA